MSPESANAPSTLDPVPAGPLPEIPAGPARRPIDLSIDGRDLTVPEGTTLLEAARSLGIDTPTLCFLENLTPVNVCRICVVEWRARGRSSRPARARPSPG